MREAKPQYPGHFLDRPEAVRGDGCLSPGALGELRGIIRGFDLPGWRVPDPGCGTGGPADAHP